MPAPAVKDLLPPADLRDRTEGWGTSGHINQYSDYRDDGVWPAEIERQDTIEKLNGFVAQIITRPALAYLV